MPEIKRLVDWLIDCKQTVNSCQLQGLISFEFQGVFAPDSLTTTTTSSAPGPTPLSAKPAPEPRYRFGIAYNEQGAT